ncbi:MAG: hypothetical protein KJ922_01040 [Nanoarchaeota archaeon]|nr:hypothetical protein [Nanoarchaeota archaeon]
MDGQNDGYGTYKIVVNNDEVCFGLMKADGFYGTQFKPCKGSITGPVLAEPTTPQEWFFRRLPEELTTGRETAKFLFVGPGRYSLDYLDAYGGRTSHDKGLYGWERATPDEIAEQVGAFTDRCSIDLRLLVIDTTQGIPMGVEAGIIAAMEGAKRPHMTEEVLEFLRQ